MECYNSPNKLVVIETGCTNVMFQAEFLNEKHVIITCILYTSFFAWASFRDLMDERGWPYKWGPLNYIEIAQK